MSVSGYSGGYSDARSAAREAYAHPLQLASLGPGGGGGGGGGGQPPLPSGVGMSALEYANYEREQQRTNAAQAQTLHTQRGSVAHARPGQYSAVAAPNGLVAGIPRHVNPFRPTNQTQPLPAQVFMAPPPAQNSHYATTQQQYGAHTQAQGLAYSGSRTVLGVGSLAARDKSSRAWR